MDDDGVNHFGTHTDQPEAAHWDTPEWRDQIQRQYGGDWLIQYRTIPVVPKRD